jgi:LmbE family N-acetylglucosaminyl deacetylase
VCLGVPASSARFLGYPDQGLTDLLLTGDPEPLVTLAAEIADWNPTLLVTPSMFDLHPDHSALAVLLRLALARVSPDRSRFTEISYLVHGCQEEQVSHNRFSLRLLPVEQARKRQAILCHAIQLVLSKRRFLTFA